MRTEARILLVIAACSGCTTSARPTAANQYSIALDPSRRLVDLTQSERHTYCNWTVSTVGGYDKRIRCSGFIYRTPSSLEACVEGVAGIPRTCEATVGRSLACMRAANGDVCALGPWGPLVECSWYRLKGCQ